MNEIENEQTQLSKNETCTTEATDTTTMFDEKKNAVKISEREGGSTSLDDKDGEDTTKTTTDSSTSSCHVYYYTMNEFPSKEYFTIRSMYLALSIPVYRTAELRKKLKHLLLQQTQTKNIYPDPTNIKNRRLLLFKDVIITTTSSSSNDNDNNDKSTDNKKIQQRIQQLKDQYCQDPFLSSIIQKKEEEKEQDEQDGGSIQQNDEDHNIIRWYRSECDTKITTTTTNDPGPGFVNATSSYGVHNNNLTCCYTLERTYDDLSVEEIFQKLFNTTNNHRLHPHSLITPTTMNGITSSSSNSASASPSTTTTAVVDSTGSGSERGNNMIAISQPPTSFETIGHIIHLNLRPEHLPYKYWIGNVLLDKNPSSMIRTVVNKMGSIETEYRTFPMEVIAGYGNQQNDANEKNDDDWSITTVKEEGCTFQLDFRTVYWNSRLSGEHKRLVERILVKQRQQQESECATTTNSSSSTTFLCSAHDSVVVVADLMAGIGPFAIPLTSPYSTVRTKQQQRSKKRKLDSDITETSNQHKQQQQHSLLPPPTTKVIVHANDLNPESYKYLQMNATLNDCYPEQLVCYNTDARLFLHQLQDKIIKEQDKEKREQPNGAPTNSHSLLYEIDHVIMNLPASAPEFLDSFQNWRLKKLPRVHVHCFELKPPYLQSYHSTKNKSTDDVKGNDNSYHNNNPVDDHSTPPSIDTKTNRNIDDDHEQNSIILDFDTTTVASMGNTTNVNSSLTSSEPIVVVMTIQDTYQAAVNRCAKNLGCPLDWKQHEIDVHLVRDVSPSKFMLCVSFILPKEMRVIILKK